MRVMGGQGPDGVCEDDNKYMWPHPEAFAAALLRAKVGASQPLDHHT